MFTKINIMNKRRLKYPSICVSVNQSVPTVAKNRRVSTRLRRQGLRTDRRSRNQGKSGALRFFELFSDSKRWHKIDAILNLTLWHPIQQQ
jgi:hypothetical protein